MGSGLQDFSVSPGPCVLSRSRSRSGPDWTWTGLDLTGPDLDWTGPDWTGLDLTWTGTWSLTIYILSILRVFLNKSRYVYSSFRNRAKGNSLTMKSFAFLMFKTIFASISRVLLFSAWLYVTNNGEFCSMRTFLGYYLTVLVLVIFHFFFNKMRPSCSSSYWIGLIFIM